MKAEEWNAYRDQPRPFCKMYGLMHILQKRIPALINTLLKPRLYISAANSP